MLIFSFKEEYLKNYKYILFFFFINTITQKNSGLFKLNFRSNMDKPKHWIKNKCYLKM